MHGTIARQDWYRGIEASTVASAMVNEACSLAPVVEHVVETWEYDDMIRLAEQSG